MRGAFWTAVFAFGLMAAGQAAIQSVERVSVASGKPGAQADFSSSNGSISDDGRLVAFSSQATNLVAGDTNNWADIYVRDRQSHQTRRISLTSGGGQVDGNSTFPVISGNGQFVAFDSESSLLPGGAAGKRDVFVHNLSTGVTERISKSSEGVAGNGTSGGAGISRDGRFVAFFSHATNLVAGDTNGFADAFLHDRQTGVTERISVTSAEAQANGDAVFGPYRVSDDGNFIAFQSRATNLAPGDTDTRDDVFVRDRAAGLTEIISVSSSGQHGTQDAGRPVMSPDGRYIVFYSASDNLVPNDTNGVQDVFLRDRTTGTTERISVSSDEEQGNGFSFGFGISDDGRFIGFTSMASNLVAGDTNGTTDGFVRDRDLSTTERVTVAAGGAEASGGIDDLSPDARFLVIASAAPNLVTGDTNGVSDIFVSEFGTAGGNRAPNADAGPDQSVQTESATAPVQLDGTGSSDPDNDALTYLWTENGQTLAAGESPTVTLAVGRHEITLQVKDTSSAADTDLVIITVQAGPPLGDFPLEADALGSSKIQLKWTDPDKKVKRYDIERSLDSGKSWSLIGKLNAAKKKGNKNTFLDKNVTPETEPPGAAGIAAIPRGNYYRVRTTLKINGKPTRLVSRIAICFAVAAPTGLRADLVNMLPTSVPLLWQDTSFGEDGFEVEINRSSTQRFATPNQPRGTATGLTPLSTVDFRVRAYSACGPSDWSESISVPTPPDIGSGSGHALFTPAGPVIPMTCTPGDAGATEIELSVVNDFNTPLEVWFNEPTPARRANGSGAVVGYGSAPRTGSRTFPAGASGARVANLAFRASANASRGSVPGQWILFTSDPAHRVVVFTLDGTVQ